jgi:inhibitor of KinA sporulation pathway (predicted exonuclease)
MYIIFDLEATCDDKVKIENEIIEIGALKIDKDLNIVEEFQRFVKPIKNPILTEFCKDLTKIKQSDVDNANTFDIVCNEFMKFIGDDYLLCSWGFYDKSQLTKDCILHGIQSAWVNEHISLKHQHGAMFNLGKGVGVTQALRMGGMEFEGTLHRGIDDAKNITKIFKTYYKKWDFNKR